MRRAVWALTVGVEVSENDGGSETPGRIERSAGVVDAEKFGDEQGESDTDGRDEGGLVLVGDEKQN
jgi:hypothetical protein